MRNFRTYRGEDFTAEIITFFTACLSIHPYCTFIMGALPSCDNYLKIEFSVYSPFREFSAERKFEVKTNSEKYLDKMLYDLEEYLTSHYDICRIRKMHHITSFDFSPPKEKYFEV